MVIMGGARPLNLSTIRNTTEKDLSYLESGLSSIRSAGIDYLPFTSWCGTTDPDKGEYSFVDIFKWIQTDEFKKNEYKWIGIDSLTELSDMSMAYADKCADEEAEKNNKAKNGFAVYAQHGIQIIGACKQLRDMPCHFLVTALAKESQDDNGNIEYWAMVTGKSTQQQLPGILITYSVQYDIQRVAHKILMAK